MNDERLTQTGTGTATRSEPTPQSGQQWAAPACTGPLSNTRYGNPLFLQMLALARTAPADQS